MTRSLDSRRAKCVRGVVLASAVWLVTWAWGVAAGSDARHEPRITGVHVGFADQYKQCYWTPVAVTVRAGDGPLVAELALTVPDGDGVLSRVEDEAGPLRLAVGEEQTRTVFVKFGQANDELRVELRGESGTLAERSFRQGTDQLAAPLPLAQELLVMVGSSDARSEARGPVLVKDWQAAVARLAGFELLPTRWYGYEGVDLVVLSTSEAEIYQHVSGERLEALGGWVQMGGRLLLSAGASGAEVLAPDAPLARFAPGEFGEMIPLRQTGALETFAGTSERLDRAMGVAFRLDVPKLVDVRGRIEAYEGNHPRDLPLVVRTPFGLGEVIFVGLDLDRPPFSSWRGRGNFIDRLVARPQAAGEAADRRVLGHVTELGYTDLAGQLHVALSQFAGVRLVPFAVVAALVVIYILFIGPLDYLFLKKVVGRMELTWVTFSTLVLVFCGGTYALAHWLKGSELRVNQVDLVDMDAESGVVRGTSWSTLYSPRIDTFDLALRTDPSEISVRQEPKVLLSWLAVPGSGLSGVGRAAGAAMFTQPYDFAPKLDALEGLPVAMWSTRSLLARWWAEAPSPVVAQLTDRDHMLSGTLQLPTVWPLTDAVLVYDRWAYSLRSHVGGDTIDVDKQLEPQTMETYFRHVTIFDEKSARAYDRASTDLVHILETMMFHSLIGGELYTNLAHRSQGYVDLSSQVRLGRAVLMGRAVQPAALLSRSNGGGDNGSTDGTSTKSDLVDAAGQHLTFYRFVLPVTTASSN